MIELTSDDLTSLDDSSCLTMYDNYCYEISKRNNYILATGDNKLYKYALSNNVEVIRTLGIIEYLFNKNVITKPNMLLALNKLKEHPNTRIPTKEIDLLINKYTN